MATIEVKFENGFNGVAKAPKMDIPIGVNEGEVLPYDMLYSALASCLYATFLEIVMKKRIEYEACTIRVSGEKRTEVPTTLKWVEVVFIVEGLKDQKVKGIEQSAKLATEYCSIYQTIAHVADMTYNVEIN